MRATQFLCIAAMILIFLPSHGWGGNPGEVPTGFMGDIYIGGGWEFSNNNLEPGDDNKNLSSLNKRGKDQDEPLFIAALDLAYAFDNGLTLFGGMLRAKESRPTFGVRYDLDKFGEIELSGFYDLPRDVWKDPYLVGQDRDKTFESSYGGAMAYEISGCSLSYELKFLDVDKDLIGKRFSSLKRDGAVHLIETGYEIEIGYGLELSPGLELTIADIDGSSNAYTGFGGGLEIMKRWSDVGFSLSFSVVNNNYNAEHPVFHKKRNERWCMRPWRLYPGTTLWEWRTIQSTSAAGLSTTTPTSNTSTLPNMYRSYS